MRKTLWGYAKHDALQHSHLSACWRRLFAEAACLFGRNHDARWPDGRVDRCKCQFNAMSNEARRTEFAPCGREAPPIESIQVEFCVTEDAMNFIHSGQDVLDNLTVKCQCFGARHVVQI